MKYNGKNSGAFNYIDDKYKFRFNVVTGFYEFRSYSKGEDWRKYDDRHKSSILLELIDEGYEVPTEKVNIFIESDRFSKDFNPFEKYFKKLPKWNKKKDYIGQLSKTIKTEDEKRFREILERFLIGTIDCLLKPASVNDVCLVFQSREQGNGKTRWMRKLLPKQFRDEYLYEGGIDTRNKDHVMYLSQFWFIHLDELESLRNNDISAIKSFITRQRISVRKAFGRYRTNAVRRASFLGSVNDDKFLTDMTGNRRWLVFKVKGINYQHKVNVDGLWAQAYHQWKKGKRHWFNVEEIRSINQHNEKFRTVNTEEELLLRYFEFDVNRKEMQFYSSTETMQLVMANASQFTNKLNSSAMGKALAKHSKKRKRSDGIQRYGMRYVGVDVDIQTPSSGNVSGKAGASIDEDDDLPF